MANSPLLIVLLRQEKMAYRFNSGASIIIPYSGKRRHIRLCIDALLPQMDDNDEIIVINDSIGECELANVTVIQNNECDKSHNNLVYCRNLGAKSAKNDILIFLDEDIVACSKLVETYRRLVPSHGIVCGKIEWETAGVIKCDYRIDTDAEIVKFNDIARIGKGGGGNFAVLSSIFDDIGGFSMEYNGRWGHEDVDLFRKIQSLNKDIYYSPLAAGLHIEHDRKLQGNMENYGIFKRKWE